LDDDIMVKNNTLAKKGISAIPVILSTDALYGLKEESSVRPLAYRPMPLMLMAIEWQLAPNNPHFYHLINILLYALLCWLLFLVLCKLFKGQNLIFPFICTLLFITHPIHTEVVANIKSIDEILYFLFSLLSVFLFIRYNEKRSVSKFILATLCFFLALLSKESAITYLVIIPLILFVFSDAGFKRISFIFLALSFAAAIFLFIRFMIFKSVPLEKINSYLSPDFNTLLSAPDFIGQKATAFYILLRYIFLLIVPYNLSYDYSIATIPIQQLSSPGALFGILFYFSIGIYALINIRKKNLIAFAILFYLITISPVSNIFVLIPWTMGERFLFMPSIAFCILFTLLLIRITKTDIYQQKFNSLKQMIKINSKLFILLFVIIGLYSFKTLDRSPDWKNNLTLYSHDVKVVPNNAFAHVQYGSILLFTLYPDEKNADKQSILLNNAIAEFKQAASIYDSLSEAYTSLGVAYAYLGDYSQAIHNYEKGISLYHSTPHPDILCDLGLLYCKTGQFDKAINILDQSLKYYPNYTDAYIKKSYTYLKEGKNDEAITECNKLSKIDPKNIFAYINKAYAYMHLKEFDKAIENCKNGLQIDPENTECMRLLGKTYLNMGDTLIANQYYEKANNLQK
ncbi:MAG: tetratricopeptide repeat protein, partial [Bacteroidota bacterium]